MLFYSCHERNAVAWRGSVFTKRRMVANSSTASSLLVLVRLLASCMNRTTSLHRHRERKFVWSYSSHNLSTHLSFPTSPRCCLLLSRVSKREDKKEVSLKEPAYQGFQIFISIAQINDLINSFFVVNKTRYFARGKMKYPT